MAYPGLSLRSNPGLKLANAFGVNSNPQAIKSFGELRSVSSVRGFVFSEWPQNARPYDGVVAALQPWGENHKNQINPERVWHLANPFRVQTFFVALPQGCRCTPTLGSN